MIKKVAAARALGAKALMGICLAMGLFILEPALSFAGPQSEFEQFQALANQGNPEGQIAFGSLYLQGKGVKEDKAEGVKWIRKAAEQGSAIGQMLLGEAYFNGEGAPKDEAEAEKWYRKAAEQGNSIAQSRLADLLKEGIGSPHRDQEKALWYRKAAEQGNLSAQTELGHAYAKGIGVEINEAEAVKWYRKAAEEGFPYAALELGKAYSAGAGVAKDEAEAVKWYRKAADKRLAEAQALLGLAYFKGQGVGRNSVEAKKWLDQAATQGIPQVRELIESGTKLPIRIAIINTGSSGNLESLLVKELSEVNGVELVEREALAQIGDEAKIRQLAGSQPLILGQLLKADGLVFVGQTREGIQLRLTSVNLGCVLFDDRVENPNSLDRLAKSVGHKIKSYCPRLRLNPGQATAVSVLNLRAEQSSGQMLAMERKLSMLLESRLASVPNTIVLERRHAWSLGFERGLEPAPTPLLPGAYLIDGSFGFPPQKPGTLLVRLRTRLPNGQSRQAEISGPMYDLPGLVEKILSEFAKNSGKPNLAPLEGELLKEAREYLEEGIWASQNGQPEAAMEALDSAELLGEKAPDLLLTRIQVRCALVPSIPDQLTFMVASVWKRGEEHGVPPDPRLESQIDQMLCAIDEAQQYLSGDGEYHLVILKPAGKRSPSDSEDPRLGRTAIPVLRSASSLLMTLEQLQHRRAPELRQAVRALAGYDPMHANLPALNALAIVYAPVWSESCEEAFAYYHELCRRNPSSILGPAGGYDRENLYHLLFNEDPSRFCYRFASTRRQPPTLFQEFLGELAADPVTRPLALAVRAKWVAPAEEQSAYRDLLDELWRGREKLQRDHYLIEFLKQAIALQGTLSPETDPQFSSLVRYYLQQDDEAWPIPEVWSHPERFPPGEVPQLWTDLLGFKQRSIANPRHYAVKLIESEFALREENFIKHFGNSAVTGAPQQEIHKPLEVARFWNSWQASGTAKIALGKLYGIRGADGGLWVYGYDRSASPGNNQLPGIPRRAALFKIHLPDFETKFSVAPWNMELARLRNSLLCADAEYFYAFNLSNYADEPDCLDRYSIASGTWERHEIPNDAAETKFHLLGGKIYLFEGGSYSRHDWASNQTIMLNNPRRRPTQNQFDYGNAPFIERLFLDDSGRVCVQTNLANYVVQETPGNWPPGPPLNRYSGIPKGQKAGLCFEGVHVGTFDPRSEKGRWLLRGLGQIQARLGNGQIGYCGEDGFLVTGTETVTLWWLKAGTTKPIQIPLCFKISDKTRAVLNAGYEPEVAKWIRIPEERGYKVVNMVITDHGICILADVGGFWFLPFSDIDEYLVSVQGS